MKELLSHCRLATSQLELEQTKHVWRDNLTVAAHFTGDTGGCVDGGGVGWLDGSGWDVDFGWVDVSGRMAIIGFIVGRHGLRQRKQDDKGVGDVAEVISIAVSNKLSELCEGNILDGLLEDFSLVSLHVACVTKHISGRQTVKGVKSQKLLFRYFLHSREVPDLERSPEDITVSATICGHRRNHD